MRVATARENRCREICGSPPFWLISVDLHSSLGDLGKHQPPPPYPAQPQDRIPGANWIEARCGSCRYARADVREFEWQDFAVRPNIVLSGRPSDVRQNGNNLV